MSTGSDEAPGALLRVVVDADLCVGAGICVATHPTLFRIDSTGHSAYVGAHLDEAAAAEAADLCPMAAIRLIYPGQGA